MVNWLLFFVFLVLTSIEGKLTDNKTQKLEGNTAKSPTQSSIIFADELKQMLEVYMFGACPEQNKMSFMSKVKNGTQHCSDVDHTDLPGRLATLALRAHTSSRSECSLLGAALANTFSELARTAQRINQGNASANETRKRKLSKSQKNKIQAKQRTALAVKKKAAALAARITNKM